MKSPDDKEHELQRREQEIQAREYAIRLRELEAEINQPARVVYQSGQKPSENPLKRWSRKLVAIVKATAIGVAVVIGIAAGISLLWILVFAGVAWVVYKFFSANAETR